MERTRPWWRGLDREVQLVLALWARAGIRTVPELAARLRGRLPLVEIIRPEGCEIAVAWDGVGGRREVRVLLEGELRQEADFARVLGRVAQQRGAGRTVLVAVHGDGRAELVIELALSLGDGDPVMDGAARVVDLRQRGSPSAVRAARG